ncbi:MAG: KilA-N domain-containing protein [Verrucomicrobiales bacterium]|nr:KilA-N domain-containing protein [Verrucomicrobiales bacterium]
MSKKDLISVRGTEITLLLKPNNKNYFCITDIARYKNPVEPKDVVKNWLRNRGTIEFLGLWEKIHNPNFKGVEFDPLVREAGSNAFTLSPTKWVKTVNAIGIFIKAGSGGGTYAHEDIAFEFAAWISAEFKLYLVTEFKRLKRDEQRRLSLEWNLQRTLAKINYRIHTDAIREHLIPAVVTKEQASLVYASEADLLNVALFGQTAAQWRDAHSADDGNLRDDATLEQLVVLSNMESINALLIRQGLAQSKRLVQLNTVAITQMKSLLASRDLLNGV